MKNTLLIFILSFAFAAKAEVPYGPKFAATYEEIQQTFDDLVKTHPSDISKHLLIKTPKNRDLAIYSLGNREARKRSLVLCNHHGDEQWVAQLCVDFVKYMLWAKDTDPVLKTVLANSAVDVLPLGNPDGFAIGSRFNSRDVDINRNFPFMWGYTEEGTVNPKPGPFANSEPETKALVDYQTAHAGEWLAVFNYHLRYPNSDGKNYILIPWAYTVKKALSKDDLAKYQPYLPTKAQAPTFIIDTVPNVFYPCSGVHTDWSHHEFNAPSLTMELGHGYDLPTRKVYLDKFLEKENLPVFKQFLKGLAAQLAR